MAVQREPPCSCAMATLLRNGHAVALWPYSSRGRREGLGVAAARRNPSIIDDFMMYEKSFPEFSPVRYSHGRSTFFRYVRYSSPNFFSSSFTSRPEKIRARLHMELGENDDVPLSVLKEIFYEREAQVKADVERIATDQGSLGSEASKIAEFLQRGRDSARQSPQTPIQFRPRAQATVPVGTDVPIAILPICRHCNGLLRPHIVWFGESLFPSDLARCASALQSCDVLLVIGTSGLVYPAAGFATVAKEAGAFVAEINLEPTPQSDLVDLSLQGRAKDIVPLLL